MPALGFQLKELFLGRLIDTVPTPIEESSSVLKEPEAQMHMALVQQHLLEGYDTITRHAGKRKGRSDKWVEKSKAGVVTFELGDLVQVYRSNLGYTFRVDQKMLLRWSDQKHVVRQFGTSYELETLKGEVIEGQFSARWLWMLYAKKGTKLFEEEEKRRQDVNKSKEEDIERK